jgi:hypothetical protein
MDDTRGGFLTASVISLQKLDAGFTSADWGNLPGATLWRALPGFVGEIVWNP